MLHSYQFVLPPANARFGLVGMVRKKDKFAAQKMSLEQEIKTLTDKLSEGRVVEEGIR